MKSCFYLVLNLAYNSGQPRCNRFLFHFLKILLRWLTCGNDECVNILWLLDLEVKLCAETNQTLRSRLRLVRLARCVRFNWWIAAQSHVWGIDLGGIHLSDLYSCVVGWGRNVGLGWHIYKLKAKSWFVSDLGWVRSGVYFDFSQFGGIWGLDLSLDCTFDFRFDWWFID